MKIVYAENAEFDITIDYSRCNYCKKCISFCPTGAISNEDKILIDKNKCIACYSCVILCDKRAISIKWTFKNLTSHMWKD